MNGSIEFISMFSPSLKSYENADVNTPMPMYTNARLMLDEKMNNVSLESANIQTGQNEVRVDVTLTYEVK